MRDGWMDGRSSTGGNLFPSLPFNESSILEHYSMTTFSFIRAEQQSGILDTKIYVFSPILTCTLARA